jgi:hypothetical protein
VKYSDYSGSTITNDARCTSEIKFRIATEKNIIQKEECSFHQQIGLKFKEKNWENATF